MQACSPICHSTRAAAYAAHMHAASIRLLCSQCCNLEGCYTVLLRLMPLTFQQHCSKAVCMACLGSPCTVQKLDQAINSVLQHIKANSMSLIPHACHVGATPDCMTAFLRVLSIMFGLVRASLCAIKIITFIISSCSSSAKPLNQHLNQHLNHKLAGELRCMQACTCKASSS